MPGAKSEKRNHLTAMAAARMAREGRTYAEATGLKPEQVKSRIQLGDRLMQVQHGR